MLPLYLVRLAGVMSFSTQASTPAPAALAISGGSAILSAAVVFAATFFPTLLPPSRADFELTLVECVGGRLEGTPARCKRGQLDTCQR